MAQHVTPTCPEGAGLWLPLTEFAVRTGISLSTIRRKIKANTIFYRLEKGRYLIFLPNGLEETGESELGQEIPVEHEEEAMAHHTQPATLRNDNSQQSNSRSQDRDDFSLPILDRTIKTISSAFEQTMKEKDERIQLLEKRSRELEERIVELKTLVRVLEDKFEVRY